VRGDKPVELVKSSIGSAANQRQHDVRYTSTAVISRVQPAEDLPAGAAVRSP
jgi:hypothetical protein